MAKKSKNANLKRKNLNFPKVLLERINNYSEFMGLDFTSSCIVLLNISLDNFEKS